MIGTYFLCVTGKGGRREKSAPFRNVIKRRVGRWSSSTEGKKERRREREREDENRAVNRQLKLRRVFIAKGGAGCRKEELSILICTSRLNGLSAEFRVPVLFYSCRGRTEGAHYHIKLVGKFHNQPTSQPHKKDKIIEQWRTSQIQRRFTF